MSAHWTLRLVAAAALSVLRGATALPAPAFLSTGVAVGENSPALAYAGAGTFQNGVYTSVYDHMGDAFHNLWPMEAVWSSAEPSVWRSTNAFRTHWKPAVTRRAIPTYRRPIDLGTGYRCVWEIHPGGASVAVPVGAAGCRSAEERTGEHEMPLAPHHHTGAGPAVAQSDAAGSTATTSLPPHLGEAAQLVMQQAEGEEDAKRAEGPVSGEALLGAPSSRSRSRRQVGRRGASSSAAAASASSGPWGSSASAAAASAASGGRGRPYYGYRPGYYGRRPVYGRPYPGAFYG